MDHKRKASASNGAASSDTEEREERAAKRQRLSEQYDLSKGETPESTTAHGLFLLEQIRRTADKNGRKIAGYFEKLLPREGNEEYYKQTRMPISLEMIEQKLIDQEFANLTELESYFKRMVCNAKDFYPRNSSTFEDAERVRKALSNYMTKKNPAYQKGNYVAFPTPLPPEADERVEERPTTPTSHRRPASSASTTRSMASASGTPAPREDRETDSTEEVAKDVEETAKDIEESAKKVEESVEREENGEADEEEERPASKRTSIILRRGPGRRSAGRSSSTPQSNAPVSRSIGRKDDNVFLDVPYKELNFQEAQEKIVEEMMRKKDEEAGLPYFDEFLNLPPRSFKEYYQVIRQPLSIKKLQKLVKGIHGRKENTGISDFKSWAAFEETASLLWRNAYYFNTDESAIYALAKELEAFFRDQLAQAKKVVDEPPQPKIKLKLSNDQSTPTPSSKKITIQVNTRGVSTDTPAPSATAQSEESRGSEQPSVPNGTDTTAAIAAAARSGTPQQRLDANGPLVAEGAKSTSAASPRPPAPNGATKEDTGAAATPAQVAEPGQPAPSAQPVLGTVATSTAKFHPVHPTETRREPTIMDQIYRLPGKGPDDALLQLLRIQTHPMLNFERRHVFDLRPHELTVRQCVAMHMPPNHVRIQIIVNVLASLRQQQRHYKLWVAINKQLLAPQAPMPGQAFPPNTLVFDAQLQAASVNLIEVEIVAGLPKGQRALNGADYEVEQFSVLANVVRN
ncbi:hypothetical protein SODALDRAFT_143034 [Sodiomyces alkalinus F11]|uniref:Bromo domain-containing protein n=1 Tax=Sodiomyces alkalinus (strain CBS 110278 / VKM F-3762 / F11) TaxID=1314773 RepID=A0A3N2PZX5_SODAK|nr:hypothetical protein SODALDRAFT_143034 [Sodiomyces alkalinus F11]ROT39988.1 hypothetical protein SODALDRAFT_143034 [Sodiomyces alkalinus F11]